MPRLRIPLLLVCTLLCRIASAADSVEKNEPAELVQTRTAYTREVEFATRPIRDRYLSKLDVLKRTLGGRGDIRGALAVQEEIDRVKEASAQAGGESSFEGRWTVHYDNGAVRKVSIDANGAITMLEESGKPVKNLKVKLVTKGSDIIVEWGNGTLEKLSIANAKLVVEHFNPSTTYPSGPVSTRGLGTRTSSK